MYNYTNFGGFMRDCILDNTKTIKDFKGNPEMWLAMEHEGKRHKYSEKEMDRLWECILEERKRVDRVRALE